KCDMERESLMSGLCKKTRREFLWEAGAGFTGLALTGMLSADGFFAQRAMASSTGANPLTPKPPMFDGKAKSVIFLFMYGSPSLGSWVTYGLGSENQNLPGYVVMMDNTGGPISGAKNWSSGYMPAAYQGTVLRAAGDPILDLSRPDGMSPEMQREMLDSLH